ncbi:class I SAM-dependent methyltransferase [Agarilytica rhodophyticola]|uniref:class I SAM-dependent methyltransferase n=1 Tax=Agarilytica rhodophyticola TaxID=1737490 RepID=UPI001C1F982C|nr:class I SAM-dependent methyltransferase [Agarilytica rhodophyticola]
MINNNVNLLEKNRQVYDSLWDGAWLLEAHHYNTWPLVNSLLSQHSRRLEVAPGLRPRLPIDNTHFVDISFAALDTLKQNGGKTSIASICNLPFENNSFDLICALDIIEHVEDDEAAISELSRVAADETTLLLSTPLHEKWWTPFDDFVGHYRRYEPSHLIKLLKDNGFEVQKSAIFGMKPKSSRITDIGMWFLKNDSKRAMWWYNRIFPYVARRQKPLDLMDGLPNMNDIGEIFLVCKKC